MKQTSYKNLLLIFIFLTGISIPGTMMFFSKDEESHQENALFSDTINLKYLPKAFNEYFNNSFAFRKDLIKSFYATRVFVLEESFIDNKIIVGKNGWLYYAPDTDGYGISDYSGNLRLSEKDLTTITNSLKEQNQWLTKKGIQYLVVICPNKQSIYPEYLPTSVKRGKNIIVDQLLTHLKVHSDVPVLDLRSTMLEQKKKNDELLYYKTDSHWNYLGGFYATKCIIEKLNRKNLEIPGLKDCKVNTKLCEGKDITGMMGINTYFEELDPEINLPHSQIDSTSMPKVLVIHDSFFSALKPFFKSSFREVIARQSYIYGFDFTSIEKEKPDVVILQLAERYINTLIRNNPEIIKKGN